MEYKFTIDKFEGPLDLLLHLIKESDVDIFDINISEITEQYLNYIDSMDSLNLNIDSEYLVMAAELIEMKSKSLLPNEVTDDGDDYEENARDNLINRLLEYQKYKELSLEFRDMESQRKLMYSKIPSDISCFKSSEVKLEEDISLDDLIKAFMEFQKKQNLAKPLNTVVTRKEYSVDKRCFDIMRRVNNSGSVRFEDLFDIKSKSYVVVTFLAILDLAKKGRIKIKQDNNLDGIILFSKEEV